MRYLVLLLLLSGVCRGQDEFQDYVRVTAYRLTEYDGFAGLASKYLKSYGIASDYIRWTESTDPQLARNLIALKQEARKEWPRTDFICYSDNADCPMADKMIIIEVNKYRDTILLQDYMIFSPGDKKQMYDKNRKLGTILPTEFRSLFEREGFRDEIEKSYLERDSLKIDKLTYRKIPFYNYTTKSFEKQFGKFQIVNTVTDSSYSGISIRRTAYFDRLQISIDEESDRMDRVSTEIPEFPEDDFNDQFDLSVNGISIGEPENKFISKFPLSAYHKLYSTPRLTVHELEDDYYYEVKLMGKAGLIKFHMKKHRISKIEIQFHYPPY